MQQLNALFILCFFIIIGCDNSNVSSELGKVAIIPKPLNIKIADGYFSLNPDVKIVVENESQVQIVHSFFSPFKQKYAWNPAIN